MQENAPYSRMEIQSRLIRYLDGEMSPEEIAQLNALLEQFPAYRTELQTLQALRLSVQELPTPDDSPDHQDMWRQIAHQIKADEQSPLLEVDPAFISAYCDREIPPHDPDKQAFEAQLYRNEPASQLLASFSAISESIRQYGYRLEAACTVDVSQQVMRTLAAEQSEDAALPSANAHDEMISAYVDQALSARETIEANRWIEAHPEARHQLHCFNLLSERLQAIRSVQEAHAPDNLWPAVQRALLAHPADEAGNVAPFHQVSQQLAARRKRAALRMALPVAAAASLLLLLFSPQISTELRPETLMSASAPTVAHIPDTGSPAEEPVSLHPTTQSAVQSPTSGHTDIHAVDTEVLAVVPVSASRSAAGLSANFQDSELMYQPVSGPASSRQVAHYADMPPAPTAAMRTSQAPRRTPSSEEYLFQALSEQVPGDDIFMMLDH